MGKTILNVENSFVTFYDLATDAGRSEYITNTECGIQKGFCYPIYDEKDLLFQFSVISTEVLSSSNIVAYRVLDGQGSTIAGVTYQVTQIGLFLGATPIYNVYVSYNGSGLTAGLSDGDCFEVMFVVGTIEAQLAVYISNQCFKKVNDKCLTSKIYYNNNSNAFGFTYGIGSGQPNAIRLPLYFKEPINPVAKEVYTRSDGTRVTLSARVDKTYKGYIDEVYEETHQKLVIALSHDLVRFVPENYTNINGFECVFENEYNQNFPNVMQNVDVWSADFTIFVTPFNNSNSNC